MDTTQAKEALRDQVKAALNELGEEAHTDQSNQITKLLIEHIPPGSVIAAYWELPGEASLKSLLESFIARGDEVYLPRSDADSMVFRRFTAEIELIEGSLGTKDPPADAPELDIKKVTHILVPGIAFDRFGHRLGRGKGGYDKWLAQNMAQGMNAQLIGIALDCQLVEEVPIESHDIQMNLVVTPEKIIEFKT